MAKNIHVHLHTKDATNGDDAIQGYQSIRSRAENLLAQLKNKVAHHSDEARQYPNNYDYAEQMQLVNQRLAEALLALN